MGSGRYELEAEGLQVRRDAVGDRADLAKVADQAVVQVAAEVFAEGGLVAARGALAALAIEPKSRADAERLGDVLRRLAAEDDGFGVAIDAETGQTVIKRLSEQHWKESLAALRENSAWPPMSARRRSPIVRRSAASPRSTTPTRSSPAGRASPPASSWCSSRVRPGSGYSFESNVVSGSVGFIPGVEKGLEASRDTDVLAGFPVLDFTATLLDGAYHDVDSSVLAFEIAARAASRKACGRRSASCRSRS
jgi:elongation factor G